MFNAFFAVIERFLFQNSSIEEYNSRAEPSRAEPSRAEPSRAEPSHERARKARPPGASRPAV